MCVHTCMCMHACACACVNSPSGLDEYLLRCPPADKYMYMHMYMRQSKVSLLKADTVYYTVQVMEKFPFCSVPFKRNGNGPERKRKRNGTAKKRQNNGTLKTGKKRLQN